MKIISNSSDPQPDNPAANQVPMEVVSMSASGENPAIVANASVAQTLLAEFRGLQEKFEQARTRLTEQLLQNTRQVAKLSEEVTALRERLETNITSARPAPASPPPPDSEPVQPIRWIDTDEQPAEAAPMPSASIEPATESRSESPSS